ncbi:hypothetical protein A6V39_04205 [Candidatus Mycoplasma haematobovis]|uniref:Uncharacterized protein n=1 Tax=Candidatus Mycoplasma haematobovis TaxID=432608 RepID=A0A1A9QEF7_9MOLU|nr:hypothetical protein [Candidatus Mycoplasma haematobovis]OAL10089.1 hypothetical protein A6V39_04205 [Candidatus Mycoplasma haematobovis]
MFQEIEKAITSPARAILVIIRTRKFQNNIAACRLDHLIKNYGLNPRDILVITYANWGRSRILGKVNKNNDGLGWRNSDFTTINKVCREILFEERSNVRSGGVFVDAI